MAYWKGESTVALMVENLANSLVASTAYYGESMRVVA